MRKMLLLLSTLFLFHFVFAQNGQQDATDRQLGFEMIADYDATIYPNPITTDKFDVEALMAFNTVELINVIGQTIQTEMNDKHDNHLEFRLQRFERGVYLVKISFDATHSIIKKILIK